MTDHTALIETKYTGKTLKRYTLFTVEINKLVYTEVFLLYPQAFAWNGEV